MAIDSSGNGGNLAPMKTLKDMLAEARQVVPEEGPEALKSRLDEYLPQFKDAKVGVVGAGGEVTLEAAKQPIFIHDLFRHTSGFTYANALHQCLKGERIDYWLSVGAQPSDKVKVLIKKYGTNGARLEQQQAALEKIHAKRRQPLAYARAARPAAEESGGEAAESSGESGEE